MTNLYSYVLDGVPLTQMQRFTINMLDGNPPFIVSDILPPGDYVDVSSIENWKKYGRRTSKDYKFVRNEIKLLANAEGWSNLNASEKDIAAKLFLVNQSKRTELYTIKEQIKQGFRFHGRSIKVRDQRWSYAEMELLNRLGKTNWRTVWDDLNENNLVSQYVNNGLEGTVEGDPVGLFDYLDARVGTVYEANGLRGKGFPNIDQITDMIIDIVKNGNY